MSLHTIRALDGQEYVLLPVAAYRSLKKEIDRELSDTSKVGQEDDYIPFDVANYVGNPVALARINARLTQEELAHRLGVSQAYVSKIESQERVSPKTLAKVKDALAKRKGR